MLFAGCYPTVIFGRDPRDGARTSPTTKARARGCDFYAELGSECQHWCPRTRGFHTAAGKQDPLHRCRQGLAARALASGTTCFRRLPVPGKAPTLPDMITFE